VILFESLSYLLSKTVLSYRLFHFIYMMGCQMVMTKSCKFTRETNAFS